MPPESPEKPFFRDSSYQDAYFTTHDLKTRGWTLTMIQKLLPDHDAEKENYMRYQGRYGSRQIQHPVKLYDQDRIKQLEDSEDFFVLYEKAQKALLRGAKRRETVLEQKRQLIEMTLDSYHPEIHIELGWHLNLRQYKETLRSCLLLWQQAHIPSDMVEEAVPLLKAKFLEAYQQSKEKRTGKRKKNHLVRSA
ncbi:hypothetical protein [Deinococcus cellulosilyticus]|nr:hypothetical protein [Deinococcus cellulosilyticus]